MSLGSNRLRVASGGFWGAFLVLLFEGRECLDSEFDVVCQGFSVVLGECLGLDQESVHSGVGGSQVEFWRRLVAEERVGGDVQCCGEGCSYARVSDVAAAFANVDGALGNLGDAGELFDGESLPYADALQRGFRILGVFTTRFFFGHNRVWLWRLGRSLERIYGKLLH